VRTWSDQIGLGRNSGHFDGRGNHRPERETEECEGASAHGVLLLPVGTIADLSTIARFAAGSQ
jgi:hypothetical protein